MIFLLFLMIAVGIFIALKIYRWARIPTGGCFSRTKVATEKIDTGSALSRAKARKRADLLADICRETRIFPRDEGYDAEVGKMLAALELRKNGAPVTINDIYLLQCICCVAAIPVSLLFVVAMSIGLGTFTPIGFLGVLAAPLLYYAPLKNLQQNFVDEQLDAMSQWLEFYNMYYSQFSQTENNALLIDIIDNFLPLANPQLAKLLKRFRTDIDVGGDEYALDKLKDRYPDNVKIHKFVSAAKMRLGGDASSIDMLRSVQDDLLTEEALAYKSYLIGLNKVVSRVINAVIMIGLALTFGIMVAAMIV